MARGGTVNWHAEVLNPAAKRAAVRLVPAVSGFYLAGGTGLALRLGHRVSLDLDFFSEQNPLKDSDRGLLLEAIRAGGKVEVEQNKDGSLHLLVEGAHISFIRYPYPLLGTCDKWGDIPVAPVEDIAAMKVSAIIGRGSRKDFVDLYEICSRTGLEAVLRPVPRKFSGHRDMLLEASRALVYFEDAEKEPMPRLLKRISWERVRAYFEKEVPRLVNRLLD
ncbi:MAG: nucleotidyl transferase AbiEii/AbiGii toxin family protein [Elusimicrobiota bacterium]